MVGLLNYSVNPSNICFSKKDKDATFSWEVKRAVAVCSVSLPILPCIVFSIMGCIKDSEADQSPYIMRKC